MRSLKANRADSTPFYDTSFVHVERCVEVTIIAS
jgi:hypothetical protein